VVPTDNVVRGLVDCVGVSVIHEDGRRRAGSDQQRLFEVPVGIREAGKEAVMI
jgi:hypothetical protein